VKRSFIPPASTVWEFDCFERKLHSILGGFAIDFWVKAVEVLEADDYAHVVLEEYPSGEEAPINTAMIKILRGSAYVFDEVPL
jgi:hypothetical protein